MMLIDFWLCRCLRHFFKSLIPKDSNSDYGLVENYRFVLCEKRRKKRLEDLTLESEKKGKKNCRENGHFKFFGHFAKAIVRWPTRDMLQIKKLLHANKMKLLQIKKRCCKLKNITANKVKVAANFQNELLQIKRMLLQVKTSKVCARTEVGIRIFIFLSGKLLYIFLGLCDYSDKFPKMFCSSCSMECPSTANFCH